MGPVWATDAVVKFKAAKKRRIPKPRARKVGDRGVPLAEIAERLLRLRGLSVPRKAAT
jgi:hypothetical protein